MRERERERERERLCVYESGRERDRIGTRRSCNPTHILRERERQRETERKRETERDREKARDRGERNRESLCV